MDNDADDLDDDDVGEVLPEHFGDDLDIETKEKEINQVGWQTYGQCCQILACFWKFLFLFFAGFTRALKVLESQNKNSRP